MYATDDSSDHKPPFLEEMAPAMGQPHEVPHSFRGPSQDDSGMIRCNGVDEEEEDDHLLDILVEDDCDVNIEGSIVTMDNENENPTLEDDGMTMSSFSHSHFDLQEGEQVEDDMSFLAADPFSAMTQAVAQVDDTERHEYDLAMDLAPQLVREETVWDDFLWSEDYHVHRAALRVARYWKARHHVFGEDRWLRPLNQTGTGALDTQDIELLRSGYYVTLARPHNAGVVTFMDYSRLPATDGYSTLRISFYYCKLYAKAARNGFITFHCKSGAPRPPLNMTQIATSIYNVALPGKMKQRKVFVVKTCFEPGREHLLDFLTFQTQKYIGLVSNAKADRIMGNSVARALQLLQQTTGVESDCLPTSVGGRFDYNRGIQDWIRARLSNELWQQSFCTTTTITTANLGMDRFDRSDKGWYEDGRHDSQRRKRDARNEKASVMLLPGVFSRRHRQEDHPGSVITITHSRTRTKQKATTTPKPQPQPQPLVLPKLDWVDYRNPTKMIEEKRNKIDNYLQSVTTDRRQASVR